ncbi:MAG: hypothetical protein WCL39_07115 [Armatimonadota bacterium]
MRFVNAAFAVLLATLPLLSTPAEAVTIEVRTAGAATQVVINGRPALSLRTSFQSYDPAQRAALAAKRIDDMATAGQPPWKISTKTNKAGTALIWGKQVIAFATAAEARAQKSTPSSLASTWAAQLRTLLTLPPLKLAVTSITAPVNETRKVRLVGFSKGPFTVAVAPEGIAAASLGSDNVLSVQGVRPGGAVVTVSAPEGSQQLTVTVAKYAGRLSASELTALVTGDSIPVELVSEAAWRAARVACILEPGAQPDVNLAAKPAAMSSSAVSQKIPVVVRMTGAGYLEARVALTVEVKKTTLPGPPTQVLFYSNHPETVLRPQPLYAAPIEPGESARLLYHHQNGTGNKLRVSIVLVNTTDAPTQVHLIGALADPRQDPIIVGYRAGAQFLKDLYAQTGYVIDLPAKSRTVLWTGVLQKMETASGILQMRQLTGTNGVLVRVLSEPSSVVRTMQDIVSTESDDYTISYSAHQYPKPNREIHEEYSAGSRWLFIRVGKHAIPNTKEELILYGNYGVIYDIDLTLNNPTGVVKDIQVMFDPTAGVAGVASMIDGRFFGRSHVVGMREFSLASYKLAPGEKRRVRVSTVPLAGSNYPATIVVRS